MFFKFLILFCVFTQSLSYLEQKPNYIHECDYNNPELSKCSAQTVQQIFNQLSTVGIEGLEESIGIIEPLRLKKVKVISGDGPVGINAVLRDVVVNGFKDMQILDNKFLIKNNDVVWHTLITLPKLLFDSRLRVNGRILIIPLNGRGKFFFEASNMKIKLRTYSNFYDLDGHTFYNVTSTRVTFTVSGLKLKIDGLFNGVKELEDGTNIFLNENWEAALEAIRPIITKTIEDILLDLMSKIFHHLPGEWLVRNLPYIKQ